MAEASARTTGLAEARRLYAERAWHAAFNTLTHLDEQAPLGTADLQLLAWSATLVGRNTTFLETLERLYRAHLSEEAKLSAARAAFWLGFRLMSLGELARGKAWLGRCERLVEECGQDCVERGYLLLPSIQRHLMAGDIEAAIGVAARAGEIGNRFGEPDLTALGHNLQGRCLVRSGRIEEGMALLDESMLAVTSGELSPVVTGLIYCAVISACQRVFALERAREWTAALAKWCDEQPELVTFRGSCQVHRSEILQLAGEWQRALEQAESASTGELADGDPDAVGDALYMKGEIHRLRGELEQAEDAYMRSSQRGRDPHPGLAQLRAAQGQHELARNALSRLLDESKDLLVRARLLPAFLEICIDLGDLSAARTVSEELESIASKFASEALGAISAHGRGLLLLAEGDARAALGPLRRAFYVWQRLGAPYEEARSRRALGRACERLGDAEGARLAFEAAETLFEQLGAQAARADQSLPAASSKLLTARELEVLRLVATGMTNRMIADQLERSEKTIDRHVSNILNKINVSSRAAATAYAYQHKLI